MVSKASAFFWSAVYSGDVGAAEESLAPLEARISVVALSTSLTRACRVSYAPSFARLLIVTGPVGGVSLVRFESASPEADRVIEEVMGWDRIEGCVS